MQRSVKYTCHVSSIFYITPLRRLGDHFVVLRLHAGWDAGSIYSLAHKNLKTQREAQVERDFSLTSEVSPYWIIDWRKVEQSLLKRRARDDEERHPDGHPVRAGIEPKIFQTEQ
jgi:hypothetical protein